MNRKFMCRFHDLLLSMTNAPDGFTFNKIFMEHEIIVGVNKRGQRAEFVSKTGDFQGFCGNANSQMHSMVALFVINRMKTYKLSPADTKAMVSVTIDDVLSVVLLPSHMSQGSRAKLGLHLFDLMVEVYKDLGFEISVSKTVVATHKCTYLNRDVIGGGEIDDTESWR